VVRGHGFLPMMWSRGDGAAAGRCGDQAGDVGIFGLIRRRWGVSGYHPAIRPLGVDGMGWQTKVGEFGCPDIVN
jgi:hypothetical protein